MTDTNTNNATTDLEDIAQPEDRGFRVRLKVVKPADKPEPKPAHAERKSHLRVAGLGQKSEARACGTQDPV
ncbi:MAG: hypothetical protein GDA53_07645 [Rhodobacteraceae bacterium]|nr:hypothetical protein [Paracoccaceae bacterium]